MVWDLHFFSICYLSACAQMEDYLFYNSSHDQDYHFSNFDCFCYILDVFKSHQKKDLDANATFSMDQVVLKFQASLKPRNTRRWYNIG